MNPTQKSIDDFIAHMLRNKNLNCTYLPDFIEKRIYRNIFTIIIENLYEFLRTFRVEILNHIITIQIEPKPEEITPPPGEQTQ